MRCRGLSIIITAAIIFLSSSCGQSNAPHDNKPQAESGRSVPSEEARVDGKGFVWNDPVDDVGKIANVPGWPRPDIIRVRAEEKDGFIHFEVRTTAPLKNFFDYVDPVGKKRGEVLVGSFIDADNNTATGAKPSSGDRERIKGFEYEVKVLLGYEYADKEGRAVMTNVGNIVFDAAKYEIKNSSADYHLWRLLEGLRREHVRRDPSDSEKKFTEFIEMGTDTVRIKVPYGVLGVKSGGTVRVCFKDEMQGIGNDYSGDGLLKLE